MIKNAQMIFCYPDDAKVLAAERIGRRWGTVKRNEEPTEEC
jgi:hypothetical protein